MAPFIPLTWISPLNVGARVCAHMHVCIVTLKKKIGIFMHVLQEKQHCFIFLTKELECGN